jgi:HAD superfamily hydrolase (TIGR01459 family)
MHSPLKIFPSLLDVSEPFTAILLDAYGVFWDGNALGSLRGSEDTMEKLVKSGKVVGILSNSSQLTSKEIEKLHRHGIVQGQHYHFMVTSGEVAKSIFSGENLPFPTPKKRFRLFGEAHPSFSSHFGIFQDSFFKETKNLDEADFIYISIPHIKGVDQLDPNVFMSEIERLLERKLPMVCTNPDKFAHEGFPSKRVVRQGSIASLYEQMGGQVFYIGKPYPQVFVAAMNQFIERGIHKPDDILMVGDTPETDVRGAHHYGMSSALVVETGIMADRALDEGLENVVRGLSAEDYPDFFIERLAHAF